VVVLSQTLQAVSAVERLLGEMLRVGKQCVVSFPNLAYKPLRDCLAVEGRAPRGTALQGMKWYDTPNVRFLTIADFEDFCGERQIKVLRMVAIDTEAGRQVAENPNLNADMAVFVIQR
jgi:methionine biosynthesis protein MetW